MQNNHELKLIDSVYLPQEAKEILLKIYDNKINFHELKDFSNQVCTGSPHNHSVQRIVELKADVKTLKEIIKEAENTNKKLVVKSVLYIDFI
jgi:hypothetical protein